MIAAATRCKILLNAKAGAHHATAGADELRRMAAEIGLDADFIATETIDEMDAAIRRMVAEGTERIAISGGDGTVSRAVQQLAHTRSALGIIPQGTANNFATALRLPLDVPSALRVLKEGDIREVDLGQCFGRYFTESAGVGIFADALAIYGAGTNKNFYRGLVAMVRVFFSMKARRLRLTIDGKVHTERAIFCAVANTYRMGAGVAVAPDARVTDGELNVVVIGDLKRSELIPYYRAFRAQTQMSLPKTSTASARSVHIEGPHHMNVHCDDQVIGHTPVRIESQPAALRVLVDRL